MVSFDVKGEFVQYQEKYVCTLYGTGNIRELLNEGDINAIGKTFKINIPSKGIKMNMNIIVDQSKDHLILAGFIVNQESITSHINDGTLRMGIEYPMKLSKKGIGLPKWIVPVAIVSVISIGATAGYLIYKK